MPPLSRALRWIAMVLAATVALAAAAVATLVWLTLPGGDMTAHIPGLSAPVEVRIDGDGVPRVRAATALDGAAALGFLHARERLFQMDLMRRAARGELSEIAGAATLPLDRLMRTLGVHASAEADLVSLDAETRATLDAYARGVNAWIAARGRLSADEFLGLGTPRPWTASDSVLWGKTMALYLSGNWRTELARYGLAQRLAPAAIDALWPTAAGGAGHPEAAALAPTPAEAEVARQLALIVPAFPAPFTLPSEASNEWAVDGAHSATGAPLLAGDPHLAFGLPGIWYLARIQTPAGVLAGATAPGVPFLVLGHNGRIAWTFTTTGSDTQDLFVETPAGDGLYLTPDGPKPFVVRQERIRVRGRPDELWSVRVTRHGPVISDLVGERGAPLAISMASLMAGDRSAAGLLALNNAGDVAAAGRAAEQITSPNQNLLVADRATIGLFVTGRVPVRRSGDGGSPSPGADGSHDWIGWASGDALPHIVAPPSGRLVNANERIVLAGSTTFVARDWFGDERARRIREMLDATPKASPAGFVRMQSDAVSVIARDLLARLRRTPTADAGSQALLRLLDGWDATMAADRPQPLIFDVWMRAFDDALLEHAGAAGGGRAAAAPWPELVPAALAEAGTQAGPLCGGNCDPLLAATLRQTAEGLSARFGADPAAWRWGDAHEAVFAAPLLRAVPLLGRITEARIAQNGDDTTVGRGGMGPASLDSVHGASFRGVYDLADLDASRFVVAPGQSGHVASTLARNFVRRWRDGDTISLGPEGARVDVTLHLQPGQAGE